MASRRKVDSTTQHSENRADNPDRRNQPQGQRSSEQSDSKPRRPVRNIVTAGDDGATDGATHEERVAQENERNRDREFKYRVNAEGTIIRQDNVDKQHAVGDRVMLTQAEARKHQDAGVPLTLVEDQDSESQEADMRDSPSGTVNDAPVDGDPEAA